MYSKFVKVIAAGALGAGLAISGISAAQAQHDRCHYEAKRYADSRIDRGQHALGTGLGGAAVGAIIGGIVGGGKGAGRGAIIGGSTGAVGSAIASDAPWKRHYNEAYDDCMEQYQPTRAAAPEPSYRRAAMEPWTDEWFDYCSAKYRSFDSRTGMFMSYDGVRKFCQPPE